MTTPETNGHIDIRRISASLDPTTKRAVEVGAFRTGWDLQDVLADAVLEWLDNLDGLLGADPVDRLRRHVRAIDERQGPVPDELRSLV